MCKLIIFKKESILLFLLMLLPFNSFSNNLPIAKNKISFTFSNLRIEDYSYLLQDNLVNLQLEYAHKAFDFIFIGGYFTYGLYEEWLYEKKGEYRSSITFLEVTNSLHYGITSELNIVPILTKSKINRLDIYITPKIGLISLNSTKDENIIPKKGSYFDYSLMAGCSLYLTKKIGLNAELGYKNFKYHKGFNARYGLTFRF